MTEREEFIEEFSKDLCDFAYISMTIKSLLKRKKALSEELFYAMQERGFKKVEIPSLGSFRLSSSLNYDKFSVVKFREDYPELFKEYSTLAYREGYVAFYSKENKSNE